MQDHQKYNNIARFYDKLIGKSKDVNELIDSLISNYKPDTRSVLDLACGTGELCKFLDKKGYEATGIDISEEMVKIAGNKLPSRNFYIENMADFSLEKEFDVISCLFDSINHLTQWKQWENTFECVHNHLKVGGLFIFDINTPKMMQAKTEKPTRVKKVDEDFLLLNVSKTKEEHTFLWEVKVFEHQKEDVYNLHREKLLQKTFPQSKIEQELNKYFEIKDVVNKKSETRTNDLERPFFVTQKQTKIRH